MTSQESSAPRLLLITLLILLTSVVVEIETFAIQRPQTIRRTNENANKITTTRQVSYVRTDRNARKREITTPLALNKAADEAVSDATPNEEDETTVSVSIPLEIITPETTTGFKGNKETENCCTEGTTHSNIFSIPPRRPKNWRPQPTLSPPLDAIDRSARKDTHTGKEELSMVDLDDVSNADKQLTKEKHSAKYSLKELLTKNNYNETTPERDYNKRTKDSLASNNEKTTTDTVTPYSHIYKVNSNYKRYKKLNIVPPKPLWRDPNDNSWRNESISSLGIKFKPKVNATKAFQFKKKDFVELDTIVPETENSSNPGLRERLEKLSEIRKSKKKYNTTSTESAEEDYDYDLGQEISQTSPTTSTPPTTLAPATTPPPPPPAPRHPPPSPPQRRARLRITTPHAAVDAQLVSDPKYKQDDFNEETVVATLNSNIKNSSYGLVANKAENKNTFGSEGRQLEENFDKSKEYEKTIANSNYYHTEYKPEKNTAQDETRTPKSKHNQFDYSLDSENTDEYEDYELKLSKEVLNYSQTWSEKESSTELKLFSHSTEPNVITTFANILDSLTPYLNSNKQSTPEDFILENDGKPKNYRKPKPEDDSTTFNPTEKGTISNFTDNIDLPIGPRDKDKINLPRSYSYNTIPHKEISVRYNTTIIHHTTQENFNNYNNPVVTEPMYVHDASGNHFSSPDLVPPSITNAANTGPDHYPTGVRMKQRIREFESVVNDNPNMDAYYRQIPQNPADHRTVTGNIDNIDTVPPNVDHYGPLHANIASRDPILETYVRNTQDHNVMNGQGPLLSIPPLENVISTGTVIDSPAIDGLIHMRSRSPVLDNDMNEPHPIHRNIHQKINQNIGSTYENTNIFPEPVNSQLPIIYNSTVLHNSVRSEHKSALSNTYVKGAYEELSGATLATPPARQAPGHHLSPDYPLHFFIPDQNTKKLVSSAQKSLDRR